MNLPWIALRLLIMAICAISGRQSGTSVDNDGITASISFYKVSTLKNVMSYDGVTLNDVTVHVTPKGADSSLQENATIVKDSTTDINSSENDVGFQTNRELADSAEGLTPPYNDTALTHGCNGTNSTFAVNNVTCITASSNNTTVFDNFMVSDTTVSTEWGSGSPTETPKPKASPSLLEVRKQMEQRGLVPLAVIGVALNLLSLWVWQADETYNATTFLFKYLAVWDSLCLLTFVLFVARLQQVLTEVVLSVSNVSQRVSVHTTLLVAVSRWLAVSRPLHVRSLLAAGRIRAACATILLWCVLLEGFYFYSTYADQEQVDRETAWAIYYTQRLVGLALPLVLMFIFNVLLIVKTCRPRDGVGLTRQQQTLEARYRLSGAVVCISVCSLISYPISIIAETTTNLQCYDGDLYVCDRIFIYKIKFSTFVLQVLNLGVNFLFYLAFASRFRQLLSWRMRCCCCCRRGVDMASSSGNSGKNTSVDVVSDSRENVSSIG